MGSFSGAVNTCSIHFFLYLSAKYNTSVKSSRENKYKQEEFSPLKEMHTHEVLLTPEQ